MTTRNTGMIGGFGQPGQRTTRRMSLRDEIRRITQTSILMAVFGLLFLLLLIADAIIIGPVLGMILGSVILAYLLYHFLYPPFLQVGADPRWARTAFALTLILLEVFWSVASYQALNIYWIPVQLAWDPWLKVIALLASLILKVICFSSTRSSFIEQVDPDGPTAPRRAIDRDGPILPWHPETYGGTAFDVPEPIYSPPPLVRVSVERPGSGPAVIQRADVPATQQWKSFASAIVSGIAKFTESEAKRYSISPVDKKKNGVVVLPGFASVREIFCSHGWGHWKDPSAHTMGFILDPEGIAVLERIANVS